MIHRAAAALLVALLAVGCSEDAKHTLTPPDGPDYLANDSEDNLAHNFELAIEALDIDGYEALLYDGEPLASDGLAHGEYRFIFADVSGGPTLPDYLDRAAELACMGHMFAGNAGSDGAGHDYPGIKSISLQLTANALWANAAGDLVDGVICPDGARARPYETHIFVTLKSAIQGSNNITAWDVQDRLMLYCVPITVAGTTEWRLWRWVDIVTVKSTEDAALSLIKVLYMDRVLHGPKE